VLGGVFLIAAAPAGAGVLDASWIAPTTKTDGSPLTDLASYRVYYGTTNPPCPGSFFFEVPSSTPSPPPNETVTFRLTGLSTGTLYSVSVTAVDMDGNESACSASASAVAPLALTVSPTGTLSFGSVNLGSFVDQTFTVQSTRSGAVSGMASTSAPFSIVTGSPFTLVGVGASQTLTVRFSPTVGATATVNVNFTVEGDSISRIVTGTGVAPDPIPPTVAITTPTIGPTYTTRSSTLTLGGTASDNIGVTQVTWENSGGGSSTATGTTSWTASGIVLQLGANVLTVRAQDAVGNAATTVLTVTRLEPFTFTDDPLVAQSTLIRAGHITELRAAIDSVRAVRGLAAFAWTDPTLTPGSTPVSVIHLVELRTALNEVYQVAGQNLPIYTDPAVAVGATVIKATHLDELRAAVRAF
jgi:fibronectin type III domain protein/Big-like domain-containing protein